MELVSRMMDGSIAYPPKGAPEEPESAPRVGQDQKIEHLQRVPIFQGLSTRQLRAIARITTVRNLPPGEALTRAGEPGDEFFLIVDGSAKVDVSPRKQATLGPGECFGEMSLLDGEPRSATVTAVTSVRLLVIDRRGFWQLLREVPALAERLLITLSQRLRQAEKSGRA